MNESPAPAAAPPKADPTKVALEIELSYERPPISCRYSPCGKFIFAGAEDDSIERFDVASKTAVAFKAHSSWVRGLAVSQDGQTLYSAGYDGALKWWPALAEAPTPIRSVEAHEGWIRGLDVSADGALLATGGNDLVARLWDAASGERRGELSGHERHIHRVRFSPDGKLLATGDLLGTIRLWDVAARTLVHEVKAEKLHTREPGQRVDMGGTRDMAFSADGALLAAAGTTNATNPLGAVNDAHVVVIDVATGAIREEHAPEPAVKGVAWGARWHADGYWIVASGGNDGGKLFFFKPGAKAPFFTFALPHWARDLDLSSDGLHVAVAHADSKIRVYNLAGGQAA